MSHYTLCLHLRHVELMSITSPLCNNVTACLASRNQNHDGVLCDNKIIGENVLRQDFKILKLKSKQQVLTELQPCFSKNGNWTVTIIHSKCISPNLKVVFILIVLQQMVLCRSESFYNFKVWNKFYQRDFPPVFPLKNFQILNYYLGTKFAFISLVKEKNRSKTFFMMDLFYELSVSLMRNAKRNYFSKNLDSWDTYHGISIKYQRYYVTCVPGSVIAAVVFWIAIQKPTFIL